MDSIVVFTNLSTPDTPTILIEALLRAVEARGEMRVAAVCPGHARPYGALFARHARTALTICAQRLFGHVPRPERKLPAPLNLARLSRRYGFRVLSAPKGDLNRPKFIEQLKTEIRPTLALSIYCHQRLGAELLGVFDCAVNYHNALLPKYRGLRATQWSLYFGEAESGYTFHHMNERFDDGAILLQGALPAAGANPGDLDLAKARRAAGDLPRLLELMAARDPGRPQAGKISYYSRRDYAQLVRIENPAEFTREELSRRMRACELLFMRLNGEWLDVTKLEEGRGGLAFQTRDGAWMRPARCFYLPRPLYRVLRRCGAPLPSTHHFPGESESA